GRQTTNTNPNTNRDNPTQPGTQPNQGQPNPTRDSHQFPVAADKPGTNRGRQTRTTRKPGTRKPGKPGKPEPGKPGKPGTVTNFPSRPTGELVTVPGL